MSEMIKKVQAVEYEILKELDRICEKHGIKYFLGQGTLLGAAKYKGFIPWDDDIDVIIPCSELDKLIKVFESEAKSDYIITNCFIEKNFPLSWTKIRNKNTLSRPEKYKKIPINWGICIDLFPIYPLSNFKLLRKTEVFLFKAANKMLMAEFTKYEDNHGIAERTLEKVPICIRKLCLKFSIGLMKMHKADSEYVLVPCKGVITLKRSMIFGEETFLDFEDKSYPVPTNYHEYLTLNYGDYMAPLPEDEQKGHELKMGSIEWKI